MNAFPTFSGKVSMFLTACVAAIAFACAATPARAVTMQVDVSMSNDYGWLQNPTSATAQMAAKNKTTAVIATQYNNPYIEITDLGSDVITDIKLTVNNPTTIIDALKVLSGPPGAQAAGQFATSVWGSPTKTIDITYPTPIAQNASTFFTVNLAPGAGFANTWVPGFQNLLWNSGTTVNNNATLAITYQDPTTKQVTVITKQLSNNDTQMNSDTLMSTCCTSATAASTLLSGTLGGPDIVTPEPPAVVLMVLGSASIAIPMWWKKKRQVVGPVDNGEQS